MVCGWTGLSTRINGGRECIDGDAELGLLRHQCFGQPYAMVNEREAMRMPRPPHPHAGCMRDTVPRIP